ALRAPRRDVGREEHRPLLREPERHAHGRVHGAFASRQGGTGGGELQWLTEAGGSPIPRPAAPRCRLVSRPSWRRSPGPMAPDPRRRWTPLLLLGLGSLCLALSAMGAHDRLTWVLEVSPILLGVPVLVLTWRRFPLTSLAYVLIFVHALVLRRCRSSGGKDLRASSG